MWTYILRRLVMMPPVLLVVSIVAFSIILLLPGDPAVAILGEERSHDRQAYEALRLELGLDQPIPLQYLSWVGRAVHADFGLSVRNQQPVALLITQSLGPTLQLSLMAMVIALAIAVPVGAISAARPNSTADVVGTTVALSGVAMPSFLLGILLIVIFAVWLRVLPSGGYIEPTRNLEQSLRLTLLPAFALGAGFGAILMRQIRSEMLEVLAQDYVTTARAKGLRERRVIFNHAFKNALIPVITLIGIHIGRLFGGAVVIESIFTIPGMGRLAVQSIFFRDFPVLQAVVLVLAVAVLLSTLITDLLYGLVDPRVRYG
jgi:peptide/nickel transport system permease protein